MQKNPGPLQHPADNACTPNVYCIQTEHLAGRPHTGGFEIWCAFFRGFFWEGQKIVLVTFHKMFTISSHSIFVMDSASTCNRIKLFFLSVFKRA